MVYILTCIMGRYFGIANATKKQSVSSYWKGDNWCNCHEVMHQFKWEKIDTIHTACYDTCNFIYYDAESNTMTYDESYGGCYDHSDDEVTQEEPIVYTQYGFDTKIDKKIDLNHVPKWNGNTCEDCGFVYDASKLALYEKTFDGTFHMN